MQDQRTEGQPFGADTITVIQRSMLHALVDEDRQRPWAFEEIIREYGEVGDQGDVEDALGYLRCAGLVRPVDGCYVATRAAVHVYELGILSI
jgi:predicted transcriptional regulator